MPKIKLQHSHIETLTEIFQSEGLPVLRATTKDDGTKVIVLNVGHISFPKKPEATITINQINQVFIDTPCLLSRARITNILISY